MSKRLSLAIVAVLMCGLVAVLFAAQTTQLPTGDNTHLNWTALGGGTFFSEVDDPVGANDGDTTYDSAPAGTTDPLDFTRAAVAIPIGATIDSVQVVVIAKMTAGTGQLRPYIITNAAAQAGPAGFQNLTTSYASYTDTWTTNPETAVAWTKADVEGTSGNALVSRVLFYPGNILGGSIRVTQVYIAANYTTAVGRPPRGLLTGVHP